MGKRQAKLSSRLIKFISKQKLFFVGTAMKEGTINISPKGMDSLRILDENRLIWLNLTGSGNETATHLRNHSRMTIMFCAFDEKPLILRLYGTAKVYHERDAEWKEHIALFPEIPGARQLIDMQIELVQSSCGFGVPMMDFKGERHLLDTWATDKGEDGLMEYQQQKNTTSLDGHPTGIFET